jgi:hypothetical protein
MLNYSPKQRLQFGQLNQEDIDFLKARVNVKLCPDCKLKAEFKIINGTVTIDNICCRKFAVTIGDSLSIKNINNYAVTFRGKILNTFCLLETCVDTIITLVHAQYTADFSGISVPKKTEDLNMRERKQLLKMCLEKYQTLTTNKVDIIWGHFNNIVEKRNHLAHWPVDVSKNALERLEKSNRISFININGDKEEDTYNSKTTQQLVDKIEKLTVEMIEVFKFFRDRRK